MVEGMEMCFVLLSLLAAAAVESGASLGDKRLLFVSSSSTTLTVTSSRFCYFTSMSYHSPVTITTCHKRRRRATSFQGDQLEQNRQC